MRTRWMFGLAMVSMSACTRDNPAFDGGEGESGGKDDTGTTVGSAATSLATSGGESTVEDGPSATTSTSVGDTTVGVSGTDSGSTDGPGESGPVDTGEICVPEFVDPFGIAATPSFESIFGGECPPQATLTISVAAQNVSNDVDGILCSDMCSCGDEPISLTFDVPLPPLANGCFDLVVRFHPTTCDIAAYMLVDGGLPLSLVSNVLNTELPFSVTLAEEPTTPCGEGCMPASGQYAVVYSGGVKVVVPPDGLPVPFLSEHEIFNLGSGIDGECGEVARWYFLPAL